jgi:hypothetical protein
MRAEGWTEKTETRNVMRVVLQLFEMKAPKMKVNLKDSEKCSHPIVIDVSLYHETLLVNDSSANELNCSIFFPL